MGAVMEVGKKKGYLPTAQSYSHVTGDDICPLGIAAIHPFDDNPDIRPNLQPPQESKGRGLCTEQGKKKAC